jgi:hypothetical protein
MWHPLDLLRKTDSTHMPKVHKVIHPSPLPITYCLQRKKERKGESDSNVKVNYNVTTNTSPCMPLMFKKQSKYQNVKVI